MGRILVCLAFIFGCCKSFADSGVATKNIARSKYKDSTELQQAFEESINKFRSDVLPRMHLENLAIPDAIDLLNEQGFGCVIEGEYPNVLDTSHPWPPALACSQWWIQDDLPLFEGAISIMVREWKGRNLSKEMVYDKLPTSKISSVRMSAISIDGNMGSYQANLESENLDKSFPIATKDQTVRDLLKFAMLHDISCQAHVDAKEDHYSMMCIASKPSPGCAVAKINVNISKNQNSKESLSMRSTDWHVMDHQGPWICLNAVPKR